MTVKELIGVPDIDGYVIAHFQPHLDLSIRGPGRLRDLNVGVNHRLNWIEFTINDPEDDKQMFGCEIDMMVRVARFIYEKRLEADPEDKELAKGIEHLKLALEHL